MQLINESHSNFSFFVRDVFLLVFAHFIFNGGCHYCLKIVARQIEVADDLVGQRFPFEFFASFQKSGKSKNACVAESSRSTSASRLMKKKNLL